MRLFNNISSLFCGALLATSAAAELTKVVRAPVATGSALDARHISKRSLRCQKAAEAFARRLKREDVEQGDLGRGSGDDELITTGLADCIGVAVTVDLPEGTDGTDRWLLHFEAGSGIEDLKKEVNEAKGKGATNVQVQVVAPQPESQIPGEDRDSLQTDINTVMGALKEILGGSDPATTWHGVTESYKLAISGNKAIQTPEFQGNWLDHYPRYKELFEKAIAGEDVDRGLMEDTLNAEMSGEDDLDDDDLEEELEEEHDIEG